MDDIRTKENQRKNRNLNSIFKTNLIDTGEKRIQIENFQKMIHLIITNTDSSCLNMDDEIFTKKTSVWLLFLVEKFFPLLSMFVIDIQPNSIVLIYKEEQCRLMYHRANE